MPELGVQALNSRFIPDAGCLFPTDKLALQILKKLVLQKELLFIMRRWTTSILYLF